MNSKTVIKSITVIPYSTVSCAYYINDGERHATTYDKVNDLLTSLAPTLCYDILQKMDRHLPFYIDLDKTVLYSIECDVETELQKIKEQVLSFQDVTEYAKKLQNENKTKLPIGQKEKESFISRFFKINYDK